MPTKPEKYITISNKFKVYFYPIVFTVIVVLLFIASIISLPNDLGSVIVGLYILLFVLCVVLPAYCIIYAKRVLTKEKHGFAFTFYNSAIIALVFSRLVNTDYRIYGFFIVFAWCELWTLLSLLIFKKRSKASKTND